MGEAPGSRHGEAALDTAGEGPSEGLSKGPNKGPCVVERAPDHPDALAMIAGSETALAALYPPDGRFALSPTALVAARTRFLVAYLDGRPVGCGGVAPCAAGGDRWAELKRIYADPALRRRGIASAIVARLEALARDTGHTVLRLETGTRSPDAIAFYARHGYTRRGPFGAYAENGSSVFMEKAL